MVAVPTAVKQAEAEADAALDAMVQAQQETEAQPSALEGVGLDEELTAEEAPQGEEIPAEEHQDDYSDETPSDGGWEQRYKSLQGKYNAEIPRLQAQVGELTSRLMDTMSMVSQAPVKSEAEKPKGPAHSRYLKKEELDDYGEEILDMQARMAQGVAESVLEQRLQPYQARIHQLESMLAGTSSQSFWDKVEAEIPGAQEMNDSDPLWHDFLEGVEPNSGLTYKEIGELAYDAGDSRRLIQLFNTYLSDGADEEEPAEATKKPPVKPGKVASKPTAKAQAKPTFKESEIQRFFEDKARGKYRGREKEAEAKEKAIDEALEEGRITAG